MAADKLTVSYNEVPPEAAKRVRGAVDIGGKSLEGRIQALAEAALEEYLLEMSGLKSISTIREQRELRLYLLYKNLGRVGGLSDAQVGELFQLTRAQVATLINGTWACYRPELEEHLKREVKRAFEEGEWREQDQVLRAELPDSLARHVLDVVAQTTAPPVEKVKQVERKYDLTRQTVEAVCEKLEIPLEDVEP